MMVARNLLILVLLTTGCSKTEGAELPKAEMSGKAPITNRVEVPAAVRQNLGITFVKAEERAVTRSLRLAGHFGLPPSARLPHHTALSGTVRMHASPLDEVAKGQLLATIASPALLEHRHELHVVSDGIGAARDAVAVTSERVNEASDALAYLRRRNSRLKAAGSPNAELQAEQAEKQRRIRVLRAQLAARRHEVTRAEHRFQAELQAFSSLLGVPVDKLEQEGGAHVEHRDKKPRWETVDRVEVRAAQSGVVSDVSVSTGAWVEAGAKLVELRDPSRIWLVARALDSDIGRLKNGQRVQVTPAGRSTKAAGPSISGTLRVGVTGDTVGRTVPVYVTLDEAPAWVRPGSAAFVEVTVEGGSGEEVAIPVGALVRDGLQDVFFRRDPADPDKVIRVEADRGPSDGHWVVVYSGIAAGNEVVVDGAYELKLASSAKPSATGHFHADGTFHAGDK